jgi:hypothetical protein
VLAVLASLASAGRAAPVDPKRDVPDYDGRGNPDTDAGSWLLWIPRVLLSPFYLANEYVLRRPLGALISRAERDRWSDSLAHLFTFGSGDKNSVLPIASFDLGLLPRVGAEYTRDDLFAAGNTLALRGSTWGPRWIEVAIADRDAIDPEDRVQVGLAARRAEDNLFVGIGPDATHRTRSRYGLERVDASAAYRRQLPGPAELDVASGVHRIDFVGGDCCGDPSLDTRIARGELMAPPGYRDNYTAAYGRIELTVDTRRPRPEPGSGGYVHAFSAPSVAPATGRTWVEYGGVAGAALDLTGHRRTLRIELAADLVDRVAGGAVPFTEYPDLDELMPGFAPGWLLGPSGAAAQLGYSWPLWLGLDAEARVAVGNAFGDHLAGLAPRKLRLSSDLELYTDTERDAGFELLLGLGTETFEQGAAVTSVRVLLGTKRGF